MSEKKSYRSLRKTKKAFLLFLAVFLAFSANMNIVFAAEKLPEITSVTAKSASSITIKWKKYTGAKGYIIYQKKENGKYSAIKTINDKNTTTYTQKGLASATKYSYKIKSFKIANNGKKIYSNASKSEYTYTKPSTPTITSIKGKTSTSIRLKWKQINKADGYAIYKKTSSGFERIATIKSGDTTQYTVLNLKKEKKYGFAVRAYKKVKSKNIYSNFSEIKYSFPAMPVKLSDLHCIDVSYNSGYFDQSIQDSFGNYYNGYIALYHTTGNGGYIIYNLDKKYTRLSFDIIAKNGSLSGSDSADIEVYLDGKLIYSKCGYNNTTGKIHVNLDVENGEQLKFVARSNMYSYCTTAWIVNAKVSND